MYSRAIAALFVVAGVTGGTAAAQAPAGTTTPAPAIDQAPAFRLTVVGRTIPAVNYRPRRGDTKIHFAGTTLMPKARGEAKVEGKRGYMEIDARFDELEPPSRFGPEYLTYVLWAITPEGRAENLGEIQIDDDDDTLDVTTELQAFGMIVTAEPYFAVAQPSNLVVLENVIKDGIEGRVDAVQAQYQALERGSYLMNRSDVDVKRLEPGEPLDLAEARNAVMLARVAGADRYATDTYNKAAQLLAEAEDARRRRRRGNDVMMPARQAVQTAEDARLMALRKQEEMFEAQRSAAVAQREVAAAERLRAERTAREQAEAERAAEAAKRREAERAAETARLEAERAADAARLEAAREKEAVRRQAELEIEALRKQAELEKDAVRKQAELDRVNELNAKLAAEREQAAADAAARDREASEAARAAAEADAARQAAEARERDAREAAARAEQEQLETRERLRVQLNEILETRETARGLIVNVSDVLFDLDSANLKPGAREKLARIAGVLLSQKGLQVRVEGHADSTGAADYDQRLSERRANSVREYLVAQGIEPGAVGTAGYGESQPVVSNDTQAGRQQNRRVEIVISGDVLGTKQ